MVHRLVTERWPQVDRSDGKKHYLVPIPHCRDCFDPIDKKYAHWKYCYDCNPTNPTPPRRCTQCRGDPPVTILGRRLAASVYIKKFTTHSILQNDEIIALKEQGENAAAYASVLEHVLLSEGVDAAGYDAIIPLPATTERNVLAGPRALARSLSVLLELPVIDTLTFTRPMQSQKGLDPQQRHDNMCHSMAVKVPFRAPRVLLVDDVSTTGETMREGARVLQEASVSEILGLVAGRDVKVEKLVRIGAVLDDAK